MPAANLSEEVRPASRRPVLPGIQVARGAAALLVLFFHLEMLVQANFGFWPTWQFFLFGHSGVDFFFVLSGFILPWAHVNDLGNPDKIGKYLKRRTQRVYLPYWFAMLPVAAIYILFPNLGHGYESSPNVLFTSFFLLPSQVGSVLAVSWTLCYELLFYALFGVLILNKRIGTCLIILWLIISLVINLAPFINPGFYVDFIFTRYAAHFIIGMAVAFLAIRNYRAPAFFSIAGVLLFVLLGMNEKRFPEHTASFLYAICSAIILSGFVSIDLSKRVKWPAFPLLLGNASYSIYLCHYPVLAFLALILRNSGFSQLGWSIYPLMMVVTILICLSFHYLIERPLIENRLPWRRKAGGNWIAKLHSGNFEGDMPK